MDTVTYVAAASVGLAVDGETIPYSKLLVNAPRWLSSPVWRITPA